jgi:hypothetical protein
MNESAVSRLIWRISSICPLSARVDAAGPNDQPAEVMVASVRDPLSMPRRGESIETMWRSCGRGLQLPACRRGLCVIGQRVPGFDPFPSSRLTDVEITQRIFRGLRTIPLHLLHVVHRSVEADSGL